MSIQSVNLSANEVVEQLNLELANGWEVFADSEIDTVCVNTPNFELGWIVCLQMDSYKGYSFTVHEFAQDKESGNDCEDDNEFLNYEEVLTHIRNRVEYFKGNN